MDEQVTTYANLARNLYPEAWHKAKRLHGLSPKAEQLAAEYAYYYLNATLPPWHQMIERVDRVGSQQIFVHRL